MSTQANYPVTASAPVSGQTQEEQEKKAKRIGLLVSLVQFIIGVVLMVAVISFSEDMTSTFDRFGYVPTMFWYVIAMMISGMIMVSGFLKFWKLSTAPSPKTTR